MKLRSAEAKGEALEGRELMYERVEGFKLQACVAKIHCEEACICGGEGSTSTTAGAKWA